MDSATQMTLLKADLQMTTSANDELLEFLLLQAQKLMEKEGVVFDAADTTCELARIQYAAYLFRRRAGTNTTMPRFLRYELNNILMSQKGTA